MDIKKFFLIILVCIILYLIYDTKGILDKLSNELPTIEKFETSMEDNVNKVYIDDIDAIRNLTEITNYILNDDSFNLPANTLYVNNIEIEGSFKINNDISLYNLLPKYIVIAYFNKKIPSGWALCDGKRYKLDINGNTVEDLLGTLTPDLSGKFILSSGIGKDSNLKDMTERKFGDIGGEKNTTLTIEEMPVHAHNLFGEFTIFHTRSGSSRMRWMFGSTTDTTHLFQSELNKMANGNQSVTITKFGGKLTNGTGNIIDRADKDYGKPAEFTVNSHNNMPPYYTLMYIMKL